MAHYICKIGHDDRGKCSGVGEDGRLRIGRGRNRELLSRGLQRLGFDADSPRFSIAMLKVEGTQTCSWEAVRFTSSAPQSQSYITEEGVWPFMTVEYHVRKLFDVSLSSVEWIILLYFPRSYCSLPPPFPILSGRSANGFRHASEALRPMRLVPRFGRWH